MSLSRDLKLISCDKSVALAGVSSCLATLFECLPQNNLKLRQPPVSRHKPDLLLS